MANNHVAKINGTMIINGTTTTVNKTVCPNPKKKSLLNVVPGVNIS
jgi:hypothetical protein